MKLKHIFSFLWCILALNASAQTIDGKFYTEIVPPYSWRSGWFKTNLNIPKVTASTGRDSGAIRYNIADSSIYVWTGYQWRKVNDGASSDSSIFATRYWSSTQYRPITWVPTLQDVTTAGNTTTDSIVLKRSTTSYISLSNTNIGGPIYGGIINVYRDGGFKLYLKNTEVGVDYNNNRARLIFPVSGIDYSLSVPDTSLGSPYFTIPTIIRVNGSNYTSSNGGLVDLGTITTDISGKLNISDTSSMLSPYLRSNVAAATYQPIGSYLTSVPTLQQVTNAGNTTTDSVVFNDGSGNAFARIGYGIGGPSRLGTLTLLQSQASVFFRITSSGEFQFDRLTGYRNVSLPDTSGTVAVGVRANGVTYMAGANGIADIGSVGGVTTTTLTDSLNANGITGITLNTSGAIHTNPITFTRSGRTFTGSMSLATQSANRVFAGPTSGGAATPTFRALVDADIPSTSKGVQWAGVDSSFAASMASNGEHEVEEFKVVGSSQTASIFLPGTKYAFVAGSGNAIGFWESGVNAIRLGTLTSTSAAPYLHMGHAAGTASQTYQLSSDWIVMTCRVRIPDLSDGTNTYHLRAGLVTALNSTPLSGGIVFTYDLSGTQTGSSATSNWQTITASSNTRTYSQNAQNTTSVSANTWTKLQIVASSSVVYFYINGTLVATHTSNLPTAQNLVPYFDIRKTAGATARTLEIDYTTIDIKYATPR